MLPPDKTSEDIPKDEVAVEIKCALVTAQVPTEGPPMKLIGALPQRSNAGSSDFNNACVDACRTSNGVLVSFAVDGAAADANYVRDMIVAFLAKETNCVAMVDPNHVAKAVRNQIVLGTSVVQAGEGLVDPGLLLAVDVPCDLYKISDFASDSLVLQCSSFAPNNNFRNFKSWSQLKMDCRYHQLS
jgi:hypothetical protein